MGNEETVTMTLSQLALEKEVAVHEKQLEILISDYQKSSDSINSSITELGNSINEIPKMISDCKDELEEDIMEAANDKYVTHDDVQSIKNKILGAVFATGLMLGGLEILIKLDFI